jgi:hypothetical protein
MARLDDSTHAPSRQAALKNSEVSIKRHSGTVNAVVYSGFSSLRMTMISLRKSGTLFWN